MTIKRKEHSESKTLCTRRSKISWGNPCKKVFKTPHPRTSAGSKKQPKKPQNAGKQPFRPTFQRLLQQSEEGSRVVVRQTGVFLTDLQLCLSLHHSSSWRVQAWKIVESSAALGTLDPSEAELEALSDQLHHVWPPQPKRRRPREPSFQDLLRPRAKRHQAQQGNSSGADQGAAAAAATHEAPAPEETTDMVDDSDETVSDEEDPAYETLAADINDLDVQDNVTTLNNTTLQQELLEGPAAPELEAESADVVLQQLDLAPIPAEAAAPDLPPLAAAQPEMAPPAAAAQPRVEGLAPEPAPSSASGLRMRAELTCDFGSGYITFYVSGNFFTATCKAPGHGKCVLSRTAAPGRRPGQGRRLGLLSAWLLQGEHVETKAAHWNKANWPTRAEREVAREQLAQTALGPDLLEMERDLEAEEPAEPEVVS